MKERRVEPHLLCMFTPSAKGGHARYTHELLHVLASEEFRAHVRLFLVTSTDLAPEFRDRAYTILDFIRPIAPRNEFKNRLHWALSRIIYFTKREHQFFKWIHRDGDFAGIHIQEYTPWMAPIHFRRFRAQGILVFYTAHNIYPHEYPPFVPKSLIDFLTRAGLRQCTAIFTHTEGLRNQLAESLGGNHPPIVVIQHGPFWSRTVGGDPRLVHPRREMKHLLFFGTIRPDKGLDVLLLAMRNLAGFHLTIAGEPTSKEIRNKVRMSVALTAPGDVTLIDRYIQEDEIADLFSACSAVVLPYTSFSGQSGILFQAAAHGRPVVVTDVAGLAMDTRGWGLGEVAPPGDALALAEAVQKLHQPERYEEAVTAATRLGKTLSWESAARTTVETYLRFLERTARRAQPIMIEMEGNTPGH